MAERGKPIDAATVRRLERQRDHRSIREAARVEGISRNTARKYLRNTQPKSGGNRP